MILNPKDYPNLNGLFGNFEDNGIFEEEEKEDQKPDQKYIECPTCNGEGKFIDRREFHRMYLKDNE